MPGRCQAGTLPHVTANKASPVPVLVLDMTTLRFRWNDPDRTAVAALSAREEVLAVVDADPQEPLSAIAFRAMDAALAGAHVLRTNAEDPVSPTRYRVGLYNPFSGEVAIGAVPATVPMSCGTRLVIDPAGATGTLHGAKEELRLHLGDQVLVQVVADRAHADRLAAALGA